MITHPLFKTIIYQQRNFLLKSLCRCQPLSNNSTPFHDELTPTDLSDFGLDDFMYYQESPEVKQYREQNQGDLLPLKKLVDEWSHKTKDRGKISLQLIALLTEPLVLVSKYTDPHINLALEDYIYNKMPKPVLKTDYNSQRLLFYTNRPCVVIGKNQNPWKEVNIPLLKNSKIPLIRRRSGGGTVVHDLGNVNFSFMTSKDDFDRFEFVDLVTKAVNGSDMHIATKIEVNKRGDIVTKKNGEELKISGSAYKISRGKSYHHGTMLLNLDLKTLKQLLSREEFIFGKIDSKSSIDSVRSKVTNLGISSTGFINSVASKFNEKYALAGLKEQINEPNLYSENKNKNLEINMDADKEFNEMMGLTPFTEVDHPPFPKIIEIEEEIFELPKEVFDTAKELKQWEWIYGHTPPFTHTMNNSDLGLQFEFTVEKGKVTEMEWRFIKRSSGQDQDQDKKQLEHIMQAAKEKLLSSNYRGDVIKEAFTGTNQGEEVGSWLFKIIG